MGILEDIAAQVAAKIAKEQEPQVSNTGQSLTKEELYEAIHNPKPLTPEEKLASEKAFNNEISEIIDSAEYKAFRFDKSPVVTARLLNDGSLPIEIAKEKKTHKKRDTAGEMIRYRNKRFYENELLPDLEFSQEEKDIIKAYGLRELISEIHKTKTRSMAGKLKNREIIWGMQEWLARRKHGNT